MSDGALSTVPVPAAVPMSRQDHHDPALLGEMLLAVERVARSGAFIGGEEVEAFEAEFARYCGTAHAVGVSSGTDAIELALRALDVGVGDEVIVPANTFVATAEAVSHTGARPRFVDVDPVTGLMTAELVSAALRPATRCIVPVHLHGRTVDMAPILELAAAAGIAVVEDAAQAHGAWVQGQRAGSLGACGCFSFYPAKNLGAWGDAGAIVTDDPALAERMRMLRAHGERVRYEHQLIGKTARLDALQAAVLRIKLRHVDAHNEHRRAIARALTTGLAGAAVTPPAAPDPDGDHVYHQYVVRTRHRDAFRAHLREAGIDTGVHYATPVPLTPAYAASGSAGGAFAVAERLADCICSLPVHPGVEAADVRHIVEVVHDFRAGRRFERAS